MKKIGIYLYIVLYLLFTVSILNTKATVNKTVITGAVYEVEEEIESKTLEYGLASVYYHHDKAYSTITSSEHIIGYECGGSTYGSGSLTLN